LVPRRTRRCPGSSSGRHGGCCRGYCPLRSPWQCFEGPAGGDLDLVKVRTAPEGRAHAVRGFLQREKHEGSTGSWQHSGWSSTEHVSHSIVGSHSGAAASGMAEQCPELGDGTPVTATMGNGGSTSSDPGAVEEWLAFNASVRRAGEQKGHLSFPSRRGLERGGVDLLS
jgi:hypothetical protein